VLYIVLGESCWVNFKIYKGLYYFNEVIEMNLDYIVNGIGSTIGVIGILIGFLIVFFIFWMAEMRMLGESSGKIMYWRITIVSIIVFLGFFSIIISLSALWSIAWNESDPSWFALHGLGAALMLLFLILFYIFFIILMGDLKKGYAKKEARIKGISEDYVIKGWWKEWWSFLQEK
jgi:hypothetical protein